MTNECKGKNIFCAIWRGIAHMQNWKC